MTQSTDRDDLNSSKKILDNFVKYNKRYEQVDKNIHSPEETRNFILTNFDHLDRNSDDIHDFNLFRTISRMADKIMSNYGDDEKISNRILASNNEDVVSEMLRYHSDDVTPEMALKHSTHESPEIRAYTYERAGDKLDEKDVRKGLFDENKNVSLAALEHLEERVNKAPADATPEQIMEASEKPVLGREEVNHLLTSEKQEGRRHLGNRLVEKALKYAEPEHVNQLLDDNKLSDDTVKHLATTYSSSPDTLTKLHEKYGSKVQNQLASNHQTPYEVQKQLLGKITDHHLIYYPAVWRFSRK